MVCGTMFEGRPAAILNAAADFVGQAARRRESGMVEGPVRGMGFWIVGAVRW